MDSLMPTEEGHKSLVVLCRSASRGDRDISKMQHYCKIMNPNLIQILIFTVCQIFQHILYKLNIFWYTSA